MANRLRIARRQIPEVDSSRFYPQVASCQIPPLAFLYERFLGQTSNGFFVEVGGYDGKFVSNSWGLAEAGWGGLIVEPNPEMVLECRRTHEQHPDVSVVEVAAGPPGLDSIVLNTAGTLTTANTHLFEEYKSVGWAKKELKHSKKLSVPCMTLDEILVGCSRLDQIDVLIVDVEGFESEVFQGFDLARWRPRMIIVELVNTHPDLTSTSHSDSVLQSYIARNGYQVAYKDQINTVFVVEELWLTKPADQLGK